MSVWRKSTKCDSNACVEVYDDGNHVRVRDNTRPKYSLTFNRDDWNKFIRKLRS